MKTYRKSQIRLSAEKKENQISIYRSKAFRWEDTADPETEDITYHLTLEEAKNSMRDLVLEVGFSGVVESISFDYDDFNKAFEFKEEFALQGIIDKIHVSVAHVDEWATNIGEELGDNEIIVFYRHHMYMNYAYIIEDVKYIKHTDLKYESDLVCHKDSTFATYCARFKDIDELAQEFVSGNYAPFNKLNKGASIVEYFLKEEGHPDYVKNEEIEAED